MDNLLAKSGWTPIPSAVDDQFDLLKKQVALYHTITPSPAWKDYQARLVQMREGTRLAIERGSVDKFGKTHEDEQRAVLYIIDQLLSYVPNMEEEYNRLIEVMKAEEAMANRPLYGEDQLTQGITDLY